MKRFAGMLCLFAAIPVAAAVPPAERAALVALFNATGGNGWTNRTNWNGAAGTECTWFGVRCNSDESAVAGIHLGSNNLTGTLPAEIGGFSRLTDLELYSNQIGGSLPPQLGSLTELQRLSLFENRFTGAVPREIGQLTKLTYLALGGNRLSGAIPPDLGNLVNVEFFSVNGNELAGPIPPEFGRLAKVQTIDLSYNSIAGTIPRELGQLPMLYELYLNNNQLTGPIPAELGQLRTLRSLNLGINQLTGTIPASLGSLTDLTDISLSVNQLTGSIPAELGALTKLELLYLRQNQLTGSIPADLSRMTSLREMQLGSNQLTGAIPPELGRLANLERLDVGGNRLTGSLPRELGQLSNLLVLSAGDNDLTGTIPQELSNLTKLVSLTLNSNDLTGPLPAGMARLTGLEEIVVYDNQLSGAIPGDIGNLTKLRMLLLGGNQFGGTIPASIVDLSELTFLDLRGNLLTGAIPAGIDKLAKLDNFSAPGNLLTGVIPPSIGSMKALVTLRLEGNDLTGTIPPGITDLTNLEFLGLSHNHLEGTIPAGIGKLTRLRTLWLGGNRLGGAIPAELGQLTNVSWIDLGNSRFSGAVPREITNMTGLADNLSDFRFNLLFTDDAAVREFLNRKQDGGNWEGTQTRPPSGVTAASVTDRSAIVSWTLPAYVDDEGGYVVEQGSSVLGATASKLHNSILVRGLRPQTTYTIAVRTTTHPHGLQQNTLTSDPSASVTFTTGPAVIAPASVEVSSPPNGLVQRGSVVEGDDRFTLTNYGDVPTAITLAEDAAFFDVTPSTFTLGGGASQSVTVRGVAQPAGAYAGEVRISGSGVPDGLAVTIKLLSVAAPAGTVTADPSATRVDVAGDPSSDTTSTIRFTNNGTAPLAGICVSDVPWLEPPREQITIPPGGSAEVTFRVVRSKRPAGEGALAGSLRLVYVDGSNAAALALLDRGLSNGGGLAVSAVTVVDTAKPSVSTASIPPLAPGEVARFIPGVVNAAGSAGRVVSDLFVSNAFGTASLRDLRLFFSASGSTATPSLASFSRLDPAQALQLASVVSSVYSSSASTGTLQLRSVDWDRLLVNASVADLRAAGALFGTIPVFRSDRSLGRGERIVLPGIEKSEQRRTDLFLQETSGSGAAASVEFLDAAGRRLSSRSVAIERFAFSELLDAAPAGAVTAVVTNDNASSGRLTAYALVADLRSGDRWSVVDWSRYYGFRSDDAVRIPFVQAPASAGGGRRRAASHATAVASQSDVVMFNRDASPSVVKLEFFDALGGAASRDVTLAAGETRTLANVASTLFGRSGSGSLVVTPLRGNVAVSSRTYVADGNGTRGSAVPMRAATSGLRRGQSQIFAGIEDAAPATVAAKKAGTFQSGFGIVESAGSGVRVRVSLLYHDGRSPLSANIAREFDVPARGMLVVDSVTASLFGGQRDAIGDLRNLQVTFEVVGGEGAATVFVITTENGSGDGVIRLE